MLRSAVSVQCRRGHTVMLLLFLGIGGAEGDGITQPYQMRRRRERERALTLQWPDPSFRIKDRLEAGKQGGALNTEKL